MACEVGSGLLVEVTGAGPLSCPKDWLDHSKADGQPVEVGGHKGQVMGRTDDSRSWVVTTFGSRTVAVEEERLRLLTTNDVEDYDVVLGPRSDHMVVGSIITDALQQRGYARCRLFVAEEDLEAAANVAKRCVDEGHFARLPSELEPAYLGQDGTGKTMRLCLEGDAALDFVKDSPLKMLDEAVGGVGNTLRPFTDAEFGFEMAGRSSALLVLPFDGDEDSFEPPALDNKEAADFLAMMWRAKLMVILNVGPNASTLTLRPKLDGEEEREVLVPAGVLAVFATDQYRFSYMPGQGSLTSLSWYLDERKAFDVSNLDGDLSSLALCSGPSRPSGERVCVVSLGMRYAFGCDEPWKFWAGLAKAGMDTFSEFPFHRWDLDQYYDAHADSDSNKSYTKHGGFTDGIELFDCRFFDISPAEARGMDPTQRQVLEVSYIALQGGGFTKKELQVKPQQIGVFVGLDKNEWAHVPKDAQGAFGASSSSNAITSNRFNYCLNLKGPSMTIDTACSASLVATHTAKLYLMHKHADPCVACITTGVNLLLAPQSFVATCAAGMLSHKGRCFTYNMTADGYARGESTASHCTKLKEYSREDNDYAVLAGSQANQDGKSASLTAPNGPAQEKCTLAALREAKIGPAEVDTTECHGTGTALGDPIELGAYRKVTMSQHRDEPVVITSSKSNIGHCEGSAGISGFIKCVLMCSYGEGTPNQHMTALNPHIDMSNFNGNILTEGIVFRAQASYNGVLSFGFGGTNACAQVWGQNFMTSRGSGKADVYRTLIKKIEMAPAPQVKIVGPHWEDWDMNGPHKFSKPGDLWELEVDEDGQVTYLPKEPETCYLGCSYSLTGTFNRWEYELMEEDPRLDGLFVATITLGSTGEECLQVVADEDPELTFSPPVPRCTKKSVKVNGPSTAGREVSWCIRGNPHDKFRVEFYRSESDNLSLIWVRVR
mmetsp:Transcript_69850/g.151953  ORF Transcript_69850/g.151953 Transcript_69850/m.151953 type:complete len:944 (+) Transcript_69850:53-2884(+)